MKKLNKVSLISTISAAVVVSAVATSCATVAPPIIRYIVKSVTTCDENGIEIKAGETKEIEFTCIFYNQKGDVTKDDVIWDWNVDYKTSSKGIECTFNNGILTIKASETAGFAEFVVTVCGQPKSTTLNKDQIESASVTVMVGQDIDHSVATPNKSLNVKANDSSSGIATQQMEYKFLNSTGGTVPVESVNWVTSPTLPFTNEGVDFTIDKNGLFKVDASNAASTTGFTQEIKVYAQKTTLPELEIDKMTPATITIDVARPDAKQVTIDGEHLITVSAEEHKVGKTETYGAIVTPLGAEQDVAWNVVKAATDPDIVFSNGVLSIGSSSVPGEYEVTFNATTKSSPSVTSDDFTVLIQVALLPPTSIGEITGADPLNFEYGTTLTSDYDVEVLPNPGTSQLVTWSLADTNGNALPEGISIDEVTGTVTIDKDTDPDQVPSSLTIIATANEKTEEGNVLTATKTVTVNATRPSPTTLKINDQGNISYKWNDNGYTSSPYTATLGPTKYVDQRVEWKVTDLNNEKINGVEIDENGVLTITKEQNPGEFTIKITATSKANPSLSDSITPKVTITNADPKNIEVNGKSELIAYYKEDTTFTNDPYTALIYPSQAKQTVNWSITEGSVNGITIAKDSSGNGIISVANTVNTGDYTMTICATSTEDETVKGYIENVKIKVQHRDATSIDVTTPTQLTFIQGVGGKSDAPCTAKVNPYPSAVQDVTWSIESSTPEESGIIIDNEGYINVASSVKKGSYQITVKATATDGTGVSGTNTATVNVNYDTIASVEVSDPTTDSFNYDGSTQTGQTHTAVVYDSQHRSVTVPQDVTWSIASQEGQAELPTGFGINTSGQITYDGEITPGTYYAKVIATADGTDVSGYKNVTITVNYSVNPESIKIEGTESYTYTRADEADTHTYTAPITPKYAKQNVDWTVEGADTGITVVKHDTTLDIITDNTAALGNHTLTITAKPEGSTSEGIKDTMTVTITVTNPEPGDIIITGDDKFYVNPTTGGERTYSAEITPKYAAQGVTWSIDQSSIDAGFSIDVDSGILTAPTGLALDYTRTIEVTATSTTKTSLTKTKNVDVSVINYTISGSDSIIYVDEGNAANRQYIVSQPTTEGVVAKTWSVVDASSQQPIDGISIDANGRLEVANSLDAGTYNIDISSVGTYEGSDIWSNHITFKVIVVDETQTAIYVKGNTSQLFVAYRTGSSRTYTATQTPSTSSLTNVNWNVTWGEDGQGTKPDGISFTGNNNKGTLTITEDAAVGDYVINFDCTGDVGAVTGVTSNKLTVTIKVEDTPTGLNKLTYNGVEYTLPDEFDPSALCWDKAKTSEETPSDLSVPYIDQATGQTKYLTISWANRTKLTSVVIITAEVPNDTINDRFLYGCTGLETVDITGFNNVTTIGGSFIADVSWSGSVSGGFEKLTSIDLSPLGNVTSIGNDFLFNCSALTEVDISPLYNITSVGTFFMQGCRSITELDFTNLININTIGQAFLAECTGLTKLDISPMQATLTNTGCIEKGFLQDCLNLTEVNLGTISADAFVADMTEDSQTHQKKAINYRCTMGATTRYFTSTEIKASAYYTSGMTIKGTNVSAIMSKFGNSRTSTGGTWYDNTKYWRYLKNGGA